MHFTTIKTTTKEPPWSQPGYFTNSLTNSGRLFNLSVVVHVLICKWDLFVPTSQAIVRIKEITAPEVFIRVPGTKHSSINVSYHSSNDYYDYSVRGAPGSLFLLLHLVFSNPTSIPKKADMSQVRKQAQRGEGICLAPKASGWQDEDSVRPLGSRMAFRRRSDHRAGSRSSQTGP